ncbi:hypothetical protein AeMF1_008468, partial [Aphanomyces euteiches]
LVFFLAFFKEVGENLEVDAKNLADFVRSAAQFFNFLVFNLVGLAFNSLARLRTHQVE